jgi:phage tail-like protein
MAEREAHPRDPLRTYQFRVQVLRPLRSEPGHDPGDVYVAGVQKVSGLNMTVEPHEVWEGGNSLHRYANPNRATWDPITLEQGLALDSTLEKWAQAVINFLRQGTVTAGEYVKRNVIIDVWEPLPSLRVQPVANPRGTGADRLRRYVVFNAWISRYRAIPALDAMASEAALLSVELVHEGWYMVENNELLADLLP